jgi:guanosine-3',5'-bis(diphosphate) 3'-pyrophosphohydrolase
MSSALAIGLSFTETRRLFAALAFAAERHRDHPRPGAAGTPSLNHPIALADALISIGGVTDAVVLCAAILHDVIDETMTTPQQLLERFGREVADVVLDVTDDRSLDEAMRKRVRIACAPTLSARAKLVRLADLLCTLNGTGNRVADRAWTRDMLVGLRGCNTGLEAALDAALNARS